MNVFYAVYVLLIVAIPFFFIYAFVRLWLRYARTDFESRQKYTLLELKVPREITKSPAAMEIFLTALYQTGAATYLETYWQGKLRPVFSLELVSLEGRVHFYIWTRQAWKNIIESQIYAQYPTVEVVEVSDYTDMIEHAENDMVMWGTYFKKKEDEVYPIKTYIDYGLDQNPKEEHKVDPMTSVLEYLGSLHQNEYAWIQIIIQAHKSEGIKEGRIFHAKKNDWKDAVKEEIQKIREEILKSGGENIRVPNPTRAQQELIASMERNLAKFPFECCIRGIYLAKGEIFNNHLGISGLIGSFRQYSSPSRLNNISLGWFTDHDDFGKDMLTLFGWFPPLRNAMRRRRDRMERHMLEAYKHRGAFEPPFTDHHEPFVMTTEELATVFHFPGEVAATPTFDRIPAKKAEAPSNLPI
ncbi:MAG TPA: hypothetical protein VFA52_01360 [Candidatus Paceibacterota bacterium]|nr:hypothetical protein [Candidatus Paceibacterota bacterium]